MDEQPDMPVPDDEANSVHKRLRRLQEHSRSNIPAMMAHRSMSTFTLQPDPMPHEAFDLALIIVYPQDPFVGEPEVRTMSLKDIKSGLLNSRVKVQDGRGHEIARPDEDGNYLFWPGTPQFDQINTFYYTTFTLRMHERYARRALPWSFPSPRITVDPHVGDDANAFYNEQDRMLGFHNFTLDGVTYSTAHSADIVSHETAHAVLDGIRDLFNESFGLGPMAFHESFGDMTAMLVALHDDSLVRRLLDWTKGNLRLDNFVATVAEQLTGILLNKAAMRTQTVYLRNAINGLRFKPFNELIYTPSDPEFELGLQSHNYSRLFTGAYYDIFADIHDFFEAQNMPSHVAIYRARDTVGYLLLSAIELGPVGEFSFADMARAFIAADKVLYSGRYLPILAKVFKQRGLLTQAEIENWTLELNSLPAIYLPEAINSGMASALFLENEVIPKLNLHLDSELIPTSAYRNAAGYAFLTYFSSRRMRLTGEHFKEFEGTNIDVFGGLTLMFNAANKLCSAFYRPVLDEDLRQINLLTGELIRNGLIVNNIQSDIVYHRYSTPEGLYVPKFVTDEQFSPENARLVKYPVIFDPVYDKVPYFSDYLRGLMHRKND
ncbi:MAG: hypothetical protein RLP44_25825 [Aggregatilineales bacterium]